MLNLRREAIGWSCLIAACALGWMLPSPASAQDKKDKDELTKCPAPYGTVAINEPTDEVMMWLRGYQLGSPSSLLRVFAQQSNCFIVVERGAAMQNLEQERRLAAAGQLQGNQNVGAGQMAAADFVMQPAMQFSNNNAGGGGGVIGALGRSVGIGGGGALKFKEAQTSITVASTRTSVQVAAAEGKARQRDFSLGALGFGGGLLAGAGGYTNTAEGKVIAASLLDNYNAVVASIMGNPALRPMSADRVAALVSGEPAAASEGLTEGAIVRPKIDGVKLMREPSDTAGVAATLKKTDELVYLGQENNGYVKVLGTAAEGWVKRLLVTGGN